MPYPTIDSLPPEVRKLGKHARRIWQKAFNNAFTEYKNEEKAFATAWAAVNNAGFGKKSTEAEKLSKELNVPLSEVEMGMKEELEHKDVTQGDPVETAKIVAAHLKEDKEYYTKLKRVMEVKAMDIKVGAVKFVDEEKGIIEMLGMPYGGPFDGKDLAREHFEKDTDFCDGLFSSRPLLYHHGLDKTLGPIKAGEVIGYRDADVGRWVQAQLDKGMRYYEGIKDLIKRGALGASTAAIEHLKTADPDGKITRWPWFEISLTPSPCNPYAVVKSFKAIEDLTAAGLPIPEVLKAFDETQHPRVGAGSSEGGQFASGGSSSATTEKPRDEKPKERKPKERLTDKLGNEVIMYGGFPMRRRDVYQDALQSTGSTQAAEMFAFSERHKPINESPISMEEFRLITSEKAIEQEAKKMAEVKPDVKPEEKCSETINPVKGLKGLKCAKCGMKIVLPPEVVQALETLQDSVDEILIEAGGEQPGEQPAEQPAPIAEKPAADTPQAPSQPPVDNRGMAPETRAEPKEPIKAEEPPKPEEKKPEEAVKAEAKKEVKPEVTPEAIKAMVGDAVKAVEVEHAKEVAALKGQIEALKAQPAPGGPVLRAATVVDNPKMGNANPATAMKAAYDEMLKDPTLDSSTRTFIARKAAVLEMTDIFEAGPQPLKK